MKTLEQLKRRYEMLLSLRVIAIAGMAVSAMIGFQYDMIHLAFVALAFLIAWVIVSGKVDQQWSAIMNFPPDIGANYVDEDEHGGDPFKRFTPITPVEVKDGWVKFTTIENAETVFGTMRIRKFNKKYTRKESWKSC